MKNIKKVSIKRVEIKNLYGDRDIAWDLNPDTNILIGKNGSGKSTVLKLIDAAINKKEKILESFGNPEVKIEFLFEYTDGSKEDYWTFNSANPYTYFDNKYASIDIVLVDTFDTIFDTISDCKESCDKKFSPLDFQLAKLLNSFNSYRLILNSKFDEDNSEIQKELNRIVNDLNIGKIDEAYKIKNLNETKEDIKNDIYYYLNIFRNIIDSMFVDTNKRIDLEYTGKASSVKFKNKNLDFIELSSGEKQLLVIYMSILLKEKKPYILMMDEPENSLHSEWQIHFVNNIRKLNPNVQIIIATHNPLLMMDREGDEIGKISVDGDIVDTYGEGTKYMDVSTTLLTYPQVSSLVGAGKMYKEINQLFKLKKKDVLSSDEKNEVDELERKLGDTVATNFIYDRHYLSFLKFIQEHEKNIDFDKLTEISDEEMDELLGEFKDLFDD
jgi:predicted ATPase/uncharacterized protein YnzC (UPF0291/DUF896 family)